MSADLSLREPLSSIFKIIFDWFNTNDRGELYPHDFKYFQSNHGLSKAIMRSALLALTEKRYLSYQQRKRLHKINFGSIDPFAPDHEEVWMLGEASLEFALYNGLLSINRNSLPSIAIPAADRFVSLSDNQIDPSQAINALEELSDYICKTNDPLTANPEDRLLLAKQVDWLKELVSQPRIHASALYDAAKNNTLLKWLTEQTASSVVRIAATNALQQLDALWHLVKSLL